MTFTYLGTLATDLDKIRFHLGDNSSTSGAGIKPDGTNFTDEELGGLLTVEGTWQRAVAGALEGLATAYSKYATIQLGPRREELGALAGQFRENAKMWRQQYGRAGRAGSRAPVRVDGYSNNIASDE